MYIVVETPTQVDWAKNVSFILYNKCHFYITYLQIYIKHIFSYTFFGSSRWLKH